MLTAPNHPGPFGPAAVAWLCVFDADVEDDEGDEG